MRSKEGLSKRETEIQHECMVWLNTNGYFAWLTPSQGTFDTSRNCYRRTSVFNIRGRPDAVCVRGGRVIFLEFKTTTGVQSDHQKAFERKIKKHGGDYILVRSLEGMICELEKAFKTKAA